MGSPDAESVTRPVRCCAMAATVSSKKASIIVNRLIFNFSTFQFFNFVELFTCVRAKSAAAKVRIKSDMTKFVD